MLRTTFWWEVIFFFFFFSLVMREGGLSFLFDFLVSILLLYFRVGMRGQRWRPSDRMSFRFFFPSCLRLAVMIFSLAMTLCISRSLSPLSFTCWFHEPHFFFFFFWVCWSRSAESHFLFSLFSESHRRKQPNSDLYYRTYMFRYKKLKKASWLYFTHWLGILFNPI